LVAGESSEKAAPTLAETAKAEYAAKLHDAASDPNVAAALSMFAGAEVVAVED
jgi:hypothetical protein